MTPLPSDLYYDIENQVWARLHDDGTASVGITQLGIQLSGEIYMYRAKSLGLEVAQGDTCAVVELAKSIVAVRSPVSGVIVERNTLAGREPWQVHTDPYGKGWIARLKLTAFESDRATLVHGEAAVAAMQAHAQTHAKEFIPATTPGYQDPDPGSH